MGTIPPIIGGAPFVAYTGKAEIGSTTVTAAAQANIPVGYTVIFVIAMTANSSIYPTISSVADGHSNTYALGTGGAGEGSAQNGTNCSVRVVRGVITTQVDSGDNCVVTISPTRTKWCVLGIAFPDLMLTSPLDVSTSNTGLSTGPTGGATGIRAVRSELIFWALAAGNVPVSVLSNITPSGVSPWTIAHYETTSGTADRGAYAAWKYVTTVGSQTIGGTFDVASQYASALLTYKANRPTISTWDGTTEKDGCTASEWNGAAEITGCMPSVVT